MKWFKFVGRSFGIFPVLAGRVAGFVVVGSVVVACGNSGCSLKNAGSGHPAAVSQAESGSVSVAPKVATVTATSGAITASGTPSNEKAGDKGGDNSGVVVPRVQPAWQAKFMERSAALNSVEAWGVFSSGGWVDDGQLMVFVTPDGRAKIEFVPPGGRTVANEATLGAADVEILKDNLRKLDQLDDYLTTAFDAVQYEIVHLVPLADTGMGIKTRIMMVMPSEKKSPNHFAVLESFKDLRRTRVLK